MAKNNDTQVEQTQDISGLNRFTHGQLNLTAYPLATGSGNVLSRQESIKAGSGLPCCNDADGFACAADCSDDVWQPMTSGCQACVAENSSDPSSGNEMGMSFNWGTATSIGDDLTTLLEPEAPDFFDPLMNDSILLPEPLVSAEVNMPSSTMPVNDKTDWLSRESEETPVLFAKPFWSMRIASCFRDGEILTIHTLLGRIQNKHHLYLARSGKSESCWKKEVGSVMAKNPNFTCIRASSRSYWPAVLGWRYSGLPVEWEKVSGKNIEELEKLQCAIKGRRQLTRIKKIFDCFEKGESLSIQVIYARFEKRYPLFCSGYSKKQWRSKVCATLSKSPCFKRVPQQGSSDTLWCVQEVKKCRSKAVQKIKPGKKVTDTGFSSTSTTPK